MANSKVITVFTKQSKRGGVVVPPHPTEYMVSIVPGKSIEIFRERNGEVQEGSKFNIGDLAEYDSYNLSYMGYITQISDKTVTIQKARVGNGKAHRLSLHEFCWRNFDFKADEAKMRNSQTMMYL